MKEKVIVAYVPVVHEGYYKFFTAHKGSPVFVFGKDIVAEFRHLRKDVRALDPNLIVQSLNGWGIESEVLDSVSIQKITDLKAVIVMPDEDVSRTIAEKYFSNNEVVFESVFLRWDTQASLAQKEVNPDAIISENDFDKLMIATAEKEAEKSSDFWRHIGALVVKNGEIILKTHNRLMPTEQTAYVMGDSRGNFHKGDHVELTMALHCEIGLVAEAARLGTSLEGTSMYVTTFPCPPCAKAVAFSGVKKLYYGDGYGMLDGEEVLRSQGVEIIKVKKD
ncbi:MAG: deaminase [Candidatus Paceibacterota bacterium]|jgi:dCMP deaminase